MAPAGRAGAGQRQAGCGAAGVLCCRRWSTAMQRQLMLPCCSHRAFGGTPAAAAYPPPSLMLTRPPHLHCSFTSVLHARQGPGRSAAASLQPRRRGGHGPPGHAGRWVHASAGYEPSLSSASGHGPAGGGWVHAQLGGFAGGHRGLPACHMHFAQNSNQLASLRLAPSPVQRQRAGRTLLSSATSCWAAW